MSDTTASLEIVLEMLLRRIIREELENLKKEVSGEDRLLDTEEAARVLSVSPDWLYRNARHLPFARKIGPKMLRFSLLGIQRYLATRRSA